MMPVVKDIQKVDQMAEAFENIGYEYLGEFGIAGRRYLRKGGDEEHIRSIFLRSAVKEILRGILLCGIIYALTQRRCRHTESLNNSWPKLIRMI